MAHYFTENRGQLDQSQIIFDLKLAAGHLYFEKTGVVYDLKKVEKTGVHKHDSKIFGHVLKQEFVNANYQTCIGKTPSDEYYNYIKGKNPNLWITGVKKYEEIEYQNIYPHTDIRYYSKDDQLKYDVIIHPGGDLNQVQFKYSGADDMRISEAGDLIIKTSLGDVIEKAPYVYQFKNGQKISVPCSFKIKRKSVYFELTGAYDPVLDLIVDPVVIFATYTGSNADNWGFTATYDHLGNMYVGGVVFGSGYPTTSGAYQTSFQGGDVDISISKYNSSGTQMLFSTYLGGSSAEAPHSMIVDANNDLIIYGSTSSTNYPTTSGAYDNSFNGGSSYLMDGIDYGNGSDIVITKMNSQGTNLVGSTFIGGSSNDGLNRESSNALHHNYGDNARGEVNLDATGNIYIASCTESTNFPTTGGSASPSAGGGGRRWCCCKI